MENLSLFSLPIQGLKSGTHKYAYVIERDFFLNFADSPINDGKFDVELNLERRPDMFLLHFDINGYIETVCDRCVTDIKLPVQGAENLVVKFGEIEKGSIEDDEVIFIPHNTPDFNVATLIYEIIVMSLPLTNTYNCENDVPRPCDMETLKRLEDAAKESEEGSIWDSIKLDN